MKSEDPGVSTPAGTTVCAAVQEGKRARTVTEGGPGKDRATGCVNGVG